MATKLVANPTELYSLTVLEASSLKLRHDHSQVLLGGSLEHPFVALPVFKALKCALAVSALLQSLLCHPASQLLLLHTP